LGQIKKFTDLTLLDTQYSITGTKVGPFAITGLNDTFIFNIGSTTETITLPHGTAVTMTAVVSAINASASGASGFMAESTSFFRSSNMVPVTSGALIEGPLGTGYGQRGPSILTGFLALASDVVITIGGGSSNSLLGFHQNDFTKAK
jgi:hypothetical protein